MNKTKYSMRSIVSTILLALISLALLAGSFGMMFGTVPPPEMASLYAIVGAWIPWLGLVKFTGVLCLWVPRLRRISALVLTGYLGGAMMAGLSVGEGPYIAGIFIIILWAAIEMKDGDFLRLGK